MSAAPSQLDEIYKQVRDFFDSHPVVSVRPTEGTPPDRYEITYTLKGMCKPPAGQIEESTHHTIELAIPFGFPHFPPSCRPKSDIFHPDFDPAAICLGDFWQQDRSLPDLIIHIGQMINGEIYSIANAFNEEAAEWYLENSDRFPLATIEWKEGQNGDSSFSSADSADGGRIHEIDTLDDDDLKTDFDFLSLEKGEDDDITLNTDFPEVDSSTQTDLESMRLLDSQKRYYTLLKTAEKIANPPDELTGLCQKAKDEIRRAEKLHREAKKAENRGEAKAALQKYQQVAPLVGDFPAIDADIHRIKQTLVLLEDISPGMAEDSFPPGFAAEDTALAEEPEAPNRKAAAKTARKAKTTKSRETSNLPSPAPRKRGKILLYLSLAALAIATGCGGYFWYSFSQLLNEAKTAYGQCLAFQEKNQFAEAKRTCDQALQLAGEVQFVQQGDVARLKEKIAGILRSENFTQGLAGNILVDGKYVPKDEAKALLAMKQQVSEAEKLFREEKWPAALQLYQNLLSKTQNDTYLDRQLVEDLNRKRLISEFRMAYDPAQVLMQNKKWEEAIDTLLRAQKILVALPEADRGQYSAQLQDSLQKCQFANLKEQGDLSFTGSDWLNAIASYNRALASGQQTALPPESIEAIRNNIKRAELYTAINKGNKAFAAGSWDEAIDAYGKASAVLTGDKTINIDHDPDINIRKLARIILQATIIRDRQTAQALLDRNELVNARQAFQQISSAIAKSGFGAEAEFSKTMAETRTAIQTLDEKIYQAKKIEYLTENYQTLFTANYPAAVPEKLTNPAVSFAKETEAKLIFRMQCTENDGGRPLTLVMFYAFDKKTGKWSFFSEQ